MNWLITYTHRDRVKLAWEIDFSSRVDSTPGTLVVLPYYRFPASTYPDTRLAIKGANYPISGSEQ